MEHQEVAENTNDCCLVCFEPYDGTQRRPLVLPCGHSFCSHCIQCSLILNKLVCPTCRREHFAKNATDFPINYGMENCILSSVSPPPEQLDDISASLRVSREEHCKDMEKFAAGIRETISQMQGYKSQMNAWKDEHQSQMEEHQNKKEDHQIQMEEHWRQMKEHQRQMELHQTYSQKHYEVITCISTENVTVDDASEKADNVMVEIKTSVNDLNIANTSKELLNIMKESSNIYDSGNTWNADIHKNYPNSRLIITSQQLREQSRSILQRSKSRGWKVSPADDQSTLQSNEASAPEEIPVIVFERDDKNDRLLNIQERIERILANLESLQNDPSMQTEMTSTGNDEDILETQEISNLEVSELKYLTPSARSLIESNRLFAIQQNGSETRYARISLNDDSGGICIHTLSQDISVPQNAILLQHEDVIRVDVSPELTFLDLAAEGRPLGRLLIRLVPEGNFPLNFYRLCTGEVGPSYAHSKIWGVWERGRDNECIQLGDFETGDGEGGRAVVADVDWGREKNREEIYGIQDWEEGSVTASGSAYREETASQFVIFTSNRISGTLFCRFGKVEEGLDLLKEAISHYNDDEIKEKVVIADCGVILPCSSS